MTMTIDDVKAFANDPENLKLIATYLELQEIAAARRIEMDNLYRPIFEKYEFFDSRTGKRLTYDDDALFMSDQEELVAQYFAETDQARSNAGYNLPEGHCPALIAAHEVVKHEWKMLDAMGSLMGVDARKVYGKNREKMLSMFLALAALPAN